MLEACVQVTIEVLKRCLDACLPACLPAVRFSAASRRSNGYLVGDKAASKATVYDIKNSANAVSDERQCSLDGSEWGVLELPA